MNFFFKKQKSFAKNTLYLYTSHLADYFLTLFFLPFIARTIGAVEFGKIGIAQTFGIVIILLMEFGSPLIATRKISIIKNNNKSIINYLSCILLSKIMLIPICLLISLLAIFCIPIFKNEPFLLLLVLVGAISQGFTPIWYFQGIEKMKIISFSKVVFRLTGFIFILNFVSSPNDSWLVLLIFSTSSLCISIYLLIKMFSDVGYFNFIKFTNLKNSLLFLKKSYQSFFLTIVPSVFQGINIAILSTYLTPLHLGYFYGANRIYRAINSLYSPISQAFFPIISSMAAKEKESTKELLRVYLFVILSLGLISLLLVLSFSKLIVVTILGDEFLPSHQLLKFFSIVLPLTAISNALGRQFLMAINKDSFFVLSQLLASLVGFLSFIYFLNDLKIYAFPVSLIFYELFSIVLITIFLLKNDSVWE